MSGIGEKYAKIAAMLAVPGVYTNGRWMNGRWDGQFRTFCWLDDDGDCARLEAAALIDVVWSSSGVEAWACAGEQVMASSDFSDHGGDRNAARRAAVVDCAVAYYDAGGRIT